MPGRSADAWSPDVALDVVELDVAVGALESQPITGSSKLRAIRPNASIAARDMTFTPGVDESQVPRSVWGGPAGYQACHYMPILFALHHRLRVMIDSLKSSHI